MGVFEMVVVIVVVGGITTIVTKYLERKGTDLDELMSMGLGTDDDGNPVVQKRIEQLEQRVAVLEKIVTDRSYDLKEEINRL